MKKLVISLIGLAVIAGVVVLAALHQTSGPPLEVSVDRPGIEETNATPGGAASPVTHVAFAADARPDDGTPFISWDPASTIPFLVAKGDAAGPLAFHLGLWNTDSGAVSIADDSVFSVSAACRVFWDGSERFIVGPAEADGAGRLQVTVNDHRLTVQVPDLALSLPSNRRSLVAVLPDGRATASAYRGLLGGATLEVKGGPLEGKVELVPPDLPPKAEVLGPVAMDTDSPSRVVVYTETCEFGSKDGRGYTLCSILAATWDGKGVSWRVVAKEMDINEAGAGSRMSRHGGRLAISDYRGVRLLDLATGELEPQAELDAARKAFVKEFVRATEYAAPAVPGSYGDFLLVQWDIPSVEDRIEGDQVIHIRDIPTSYVAAVRDGKVVGEVKRVDDRMWVEKGDEITAKVSVPPEKWILPR